MVLAVVVLAVVFAVGAVVSIPGPPALCNLRCSITLLTRTVSLSPVSASVACTRAQQCDGTSWVLGRMERMRR